MKMFKVCSECIEELQKLRYKHQSLSIIKNGEYIYRCKNKPRCFDQPERSKQEDIQNINIKNCNKCIELKRCCHCGYDGTYYLVHANND